MKNRDQRGLHIADLPSHDMASPAFDTLPESIKYLAESDGSNEAFIFLNKHGRQSVLSRRFVFDAAGRFAARLKRLGFQKGDVIANSITNSPERLITDFGIILAGCVGVNCQVVHKDGADFWHLAQTAGCCAVVIATTENNPAYLLFSSILSEVPQTSGSYDISLPKAPTIRKVLVANRVDPNGISNFVTTGECETGAPVSDFFSELMSSEKEVFVADVSKSDLVYIYLTSGSTGFSKLVPRTHGLTMDFANTFVEERFEKIMTDRPFGWTGGFPYMYIGKGFTIYTQDWYEGQEAKTPRELWALYEREELFGVMQSPTLILQSIQEFKNDPPQFKLKALFSGGQVLPKELGEAVGLLTDCFVMVYGATENVVATSGIKLHKDEMEEYFCGKPFKQVQMKIVDDNFKEVPAGTQGHVLMKSPWLFSGYYNYEAPTSNPVFSSDGFFISGDRGKLDSEGNLYVYGREGDVITKGTLLIYLSWPESILMTCPGVQEAAVVPVYNKNGEEKICACIIKKEDSDLNEEKLKNLYMDNFTTSYTSKDAYVPAIDYVLFYDRFPETYTFKTDKKQLKIYANQMFGDM